MTSGSSVLLEIGGFDPVLQHPGQLERIRGATTSDHEAPQAARMRGRGEQRSTGADVGADDMWVLEPERVGDFDDEIPHRAWGKQRIAALGMTEPRQVDRYQVRLFGKARPRRLERQQALGPWAQQQGVIVPVLALRESDGQPVDGPELHL